MSFKEGLVTYMAKFYRSHSSADGFIEDAEGVLRFTLQHIKKNEPNAVTSINALELAIDIITNIEDDY